LRLNLRTDIKSLRRHRLLDSPSPTPQTTTSQCAILESFMSALKSTLARAIIEQKPRVLTVLA